MVRISRSPTDSPKRPRRGIFLPTEPSKERCVSFIDGHNLFRHAKDAFGHHHPNDDPKKLARTVCLHHGWLHRGVRFYTGTPSVKWDPKWHGYWTRRLTAIRRAGIVVTSRPLRYRVEKVPLPHGSVQEIPDAREKGIDLRLGLDVVRMARNGELDVVLIFSQDQDLAEIALEVRDIARTAGTWLKVVSAFRHAPHATATRGIDRTDWFRMDRSFYDGCLDPRDYRPGRWR